MNKVEEYKSMCNDIYEGETWDIMVELLLNKDQEIERLNNIINETLKRVSNIQHNLEKYEEIGYKHLDYAMDETDELKEYLIKELKENK